MPKGSNMASHGSKKVIYAALFGNAAITVLKFVAAAFSHSSAMLAEAFHSVADTGNQVMLLLGHKRAQKEPDERHPFGYGKELYFWAFVVAVSIFFVGAALSIYEGVHKLFNPEPVQSLLLPLVVLGVSLIIESYPWWIAVKEAQKVKQGTGLASYARMIRSTKRPTVLVVLFEDSAAMLGLLVAAAGITAAYVTGEPVFDAGASILIGVILAATAFVLAWKTKELLIGEGADPEEIARMREAVTGVGKVQKCGRILTMHLGPDDLLVNLEVEFTDGLNTDGVEDAIDEIEKRIKTAVPAVTLVYIEAESLRRRTNSQAPSTDHQ